MTFRKKLLFSTLLVALAGSFMSFDLPTGWVIAGSKPESYDMGIAPGAGRDGKNAATIQSKFKKVNGFGTLAQSCLPGDFLGQRVRMSGWLKTQDVSGWAALWLRIEEKGSTKPLGFDNMKDGKTDRSIKGTTDWTKYEIVLDVPENASFLAFGGLMVGTGQIWFDDLRFEVVDPSVPTTGYGKDMPNPEPMNLDFETSE